MHAHYVTSIQNNTYVYILAQSSRNLDRTHIFDLAVNNVAPRKQLNGYCRWYFGFFGSVAGSIPFVMSASALRSLAAVIFGAPASRDRFAS